MTLVCAILKDEQPQHVVYDGYEYAYRQVAELVSINVTVVVEVEDGEDAANGRHAVGTIKASKHIQNEHDANHDLHTGHPAHVLVAQALDGVVRVLVNILVDDLLLELVESRVALFEFLAFVRLLTYFIEGDAELAFALVSEVEELVR